MEISEKGGIFETFLKDMKANYILCVYGIQWKLEEFEVIWNEINLLRWFFHLYYTINNFVIYDFKI